MKARRKQKYRKQLSSCIVSQAVWQQTFNLYITSSNLVRCTSYTYRLMDKLFGYEPNVGSSSLSKCASIVSSTVESQSLKLRDISSNLVRCTKFRNVGQFGQTASFGNQRSGVQVPPFRPEQIIVDAQFNWQNTRLITEQLLVRFQPDPPNILLW